MKISLDGKKAIVCGSTQGIGKAIAHQLAASGARVTLLARNQEVLNAAVKELPGSGHECLTADFADFESLKAHSEFIKKGDFHILINNAGGPPPGEVQDANWEAFEKALTMHLKVSHHLAQWVLPKMKSSGYGRIINIISTSVKIPIKGLGVSNTVRGAMASWAKTLSNEVEAHGITVNNILPGPIYTQRLIQIIRSQAEKQKITEEESANKMKATVPAGRFGAPDELGYLASFLCSDLAGYITGVSIPVDGGRTGSL
jgi:3-oxoacyl-[acyl-carrier protein] reductase